MRSSSKCRHWPEAEGNDARALTVAAAIVGGAAIGAVGSSLAADKQSGAQNRAADLQNDRFNTINNQNQQFVQAGYGATSRLTDLLGTSGNTGAQGYGSLTSNFTPQDYLNNKDPGYEFQRQQGENAIRNENGSTQGALSGGTLKSLMSFNQDLASTGYQNAFNRRQTQQSNIYARLSGIAGLGQNSANNTGVAGTQLGIGQAQAVSAAGGSQAAGIVGASNSLSSGLISAGYLYGNRGSNGETQVPPGAGTDYGPGISELGEN